MKFFKKLKTELQRKPAFNLKRAEFTKAFLDKHFMAKPILDIAEPNPTGNWLCKNMGVSTDNTISDLDFSVVPNRDSGPYNTVWCFEVIEHLMNPLLFLNCVKDITTKDAKIFLSYPSRPKWLWNDKDHFHEYDKRRLDLLLEKAGLEIVEQKHFYMLYWKIGIRPFVRNFLPTTTIYLLRKI